MIVEQKDIKTGMIRFEINTVNAEACRKEIENSGCVKYKDGVADTIRYGVEIAGCEVFITSTPTRTIMLGKNRYSMLELYDRIKGDERRGTAWAYDDSKRSDYQKG